MRARLIDLVKRLSAAAPTVGAPPTRTCCRGWTRRCRCCSRTIRPWTRSLRQHFRWRRAGHVRRCRRSAGRVFGLDEIDRDLLLHRRGCRRRREHRARLWDCCVAGRRRAGPPSAWHSSWSVSPRCPPRPAPGSAPGGHLATARPAGREPTGPWLTREFWCPDRVVDPSAGPRSTGPGTGDRAARPGAAAAARAVSCWRRRWIAGSAWSGSMRPLGAAGLTMAAGALDAIGVRALTLAVPAEPRASRPAGFLRAAVREAALLGRCLLLDGAERLFTGDTLGGGRSAGRYPSCR